MIDICCIGHLTRDRIITPQQTFFLSGGTSFYFANAIHQLPPTLQFKLLTKAGHDAADTVEELKGKGIAVDCKTSQHTVFFENKYAENSNNRTQRVLAKADPFTLDDVRDLEAGIFHLGSLLQDDFPLEVVESLASRGRISIDVQGFLREVRLGTEAEPGAPDGSPHKGVPIAGKVFSTDWKDKRKFLACTNILKLNEHEMVAIANSQDPREVARLMERMGVEEVVITLGSYGSLIYANGIFHDIPAYQPTAIVDATGCGDTYSAGYLYARHEGMNYHDAGCFAAAMCTLKLEHNGPFEGSLQDIEHIIK